MKIYENIICGNMKLPKNIPFVLQDLIRKFLTIDVAHRLSIEKAKEHPFLVSNDDSDKYWSAIKEQTWSTPYIPDQAIIEVQDRPLERADGSRKKVEFLGDY